MLLPNTNRHDSIPWQYTSPPSTTAASSVSRAHGPASPQLGYVRVWSCISEPMLARLAASWKQALLRSPCRQILTGSDRPPVRAASSCKLLICPKRTSLKFWAQPLHTAHSCSNSAFPEIYESLSKKPFSSVPRCKKSASHHPCFTLRGVLLQVARNFEQFVKKGKARHGEVHMPGSMPLTNVSN